jgi:N4-gp56 family major capsid protein
LASPTPTAKPTSRNLAGFVPVAKYGSRQPISEHEIGTVESVRYLLSPDLAPFADAGGAKGAMVSTSGTSADVYPILYFGQDASRRCRSRARSDRPDGPQPGQAVEVGPDGAARLRLVEDLVRAVILNDLWMARLEVAVTAL